MNTRDTFRFIRVCKLVKRRARKRTSGSRICNLPAPLHLRGKRGDYIVKWTLEAEINAAFVSYEFRATSRSNDWIEGSG